MIYALIKLASVVLYQFFFHKGPRPNFITKATKLQSLGLKTKHNTPLQQVITNVNGTLRKDELRKVLYLLVC
jgi:hypothetical protein